MEKPMPLLRCAHSTAENPRVASPDDLREFFITVRALTGGDRIPLRIMQLIMRAAIGGNVALITYLACLHREHLLTLASALEANHLELWHPLRKEKIALGPLADAARR